MPPGTCRATGFLVAAAVAPWQATVTADMSLLTALLVARNPACPDPHPAFVAPHQTKCHMPLCEKAKQVQSEKAAMCPNVFCLQNRLISGCALSAT